MGYRVKGLDAAPFTKLYGLSDDQLAALGVVRYEVDVNPGFPDRITMRDMDIGEKALLLNYEHLPVKSPYQSSHAIFLQEGARDTYDSVDEVPEVMKRRMIALRGYDSRGFIKEALMGEGEEIEPLILTLFSDPEIEYIQAHNAIRGCYSGRIERA